MANFKAKLVGDAPLLMHSVRLLDKTCAAAKEIAKITGKKKKTDDDMRELQRAEWLAGIYTDDKGLVCIPADNVLATIIEGARKSKLGKLAQAGVFEAAPSFKLNYDGPKGLKELYDDGRFIDYRAVRNQQNRVMRCRPIFRAWSCDIALVFDESIIDPEQLRNALDVAGAQVGIGDWRPRFGRFHVEK